jgi:hypothetical protein
VHAVRGVLEGWMLISPRAADSIQQEDQGAVFSWSFKQIQN